MMASAGCANSSSDRSPGIIGALLAAVSDGGSNRSRAIRFSSRFDGCAPTDGAGSAAGACAADGKGAAGVAVDAAGAAGVVGAAGVTEAGWVAHAAEVAAETVADAGTGASAGAGVVSETTGGAAGRERPRLLLTSRENPAPAVNIQSTSTTMAIPTPFGRPECT
jgi:hypothetical protein